ncbi:MAG: HAMP domain-containing histidine kinase [Burkholderiaceae bacterium]|nr:HAMP domain-containing histidine kinase [Burkholderiaceae bacterium]
MLFTINLDNLPKNAALRTVLLMRMAVLACLLAVLVLAVIFLGIPVPTGPIATVFSTAFVFNVWCSRQVQRTDMALERAIFVQLLADIAALSWMLYCTGGATNPFVSFYLPALALAAAMLRWQLALLLAALAVAAYSLLTTYYLPLHLGNPDRAISYHLAGMWINFAVSALLITWFVARLSHTVRERDAQLAEARVQQLQGERALALGIQAANAAHELGTPLSTIAIITAELRHEVAALPQFLQEELAIVEEQVALCKAALERMGRASAAPHEGATLAQWFEQFVDQWRLRYPATRVTTGIAPTDLLPRWNEALAQILTTLLDNAAQAVSANDAVVHIGLQADAHQARFTVRDGGMGIPPALLPQLGDRQVASKTGRGIGLLLAFATARQIGATIELSSPFEGGTLAVLSVPL